MLKDYLIETYGCNEPIFISEVRVPGMNENALRQYFKRLVTSGDLMRFDTGIYYVPSPARVLKQSCLDPMKVVCRKYISSADQNQIYGYFSGAVFANQLGLTSQMPSVLDIVTEKESTKGRTVTVGSQRLRLKRPSVRITKENAGLQQFLSAVSQAEIYSELSEEETAEVLRRYAGKERYTKALLTSIFSSVTGPTAKKLIKWGIIYEFAS